MICIVDGITSVSINGIEYESKDRVLEIPDELYPKIVHHPHIRAATSKEIAALERIKADVEAEEVPLPKPELKGSGKHGGK